MKHKLKHDWFLARMIIIVIFILVLGAFLISYKIGYDVFFLEAFCNQQAHNIVGNQWTKKIPATELDKNSWEGVVAEDGTIFWGVHETIKCENEHKAFIFF